MKIGNILLEKYPLLLAPMEDVTDRSFRHLCKHYGADLVYTEFISSDALIRNVKKSLAKLEIEDYERPIGIQLYGQDIEAMVESAKIATEAKPDLIDINCGCPVRKIATRGAGAGLLQNPDKMVKMVAEIVKATHLPVTLKTRLGWDDNSKIIVELAERLQDVGIQAITIHGRTRAQLYTGNADWTLIGAVKANSRMKIPVIGNGDVDTPQKAKEMFDKYGVDAIMIGRATYGHPYIFDEIKYYLEHNEERPPLTLQQKVEMAKLHFTQSLKWKGEPRGIYEMRKHFVNYFKALSHFKDIKMKLVTSTDSQELFQLLDFILEKYGNCEKDEIIS